MSPRIFRPGPIVETALIAAATSGALAAAGVNAAAADAACTDEVEIVAGGVTVEFGFAVVATGSAASAPGEEGFNSSVLRHIWVPPQYR
jgi:hypothetical protein